MRRPRLGLGVSLLFLAPVWALPITEGEALNRERLKIFPSSHYNPPVEGNKPAALVRVSFCLGDLSGHTALCLLPGDTADRQRL